MTAPVRAGTVVRWLLFAAAAYVLWLRLTNAGTGFAMHMDAPKGGLPTAALGYPAPSLRAPTLDGGTINLADLRGKTVLLNFWTTWCGPCVGEMPDLAALRKRLAPQGFELVAAALYDSDIVTDAAVKRIVEHAGADFPVALLKQADAAPGWMGAIPAMPTSYIIGPDGTVRGRVVGVADWNGKAESQIRAVMALNAAPPR